MDLWLDHRIFTEIQKNLKGSHLSVSAYLTNVVSAYQDGFKLERGMSFLGVDQKLGEFSSEISNAYPSKRAPKNLTFFEEIEIVKL